MRLLHFASDGQLGLTKNLSEHIPPYAILSHTWADVDEDEVTFEDMENNTRSSKPGNIKLEFCATQASKDGLKHFWIDTCCIDKKNSSELQEAITSMFRWYAEAEKCYVFLSDVSSHKRRIADACDPWRSALPRARWFTRGWTLQELLAPRQVHFYSREGEWLGDKQTLESEIHGTTRIPKEALRGDPLSGFSVEERMRWTSNRTTTKEEDRAYCLTGIFGVFMSTMYGEGKHAFKRLQKKIATAYQDELQKFVQPPVLIPSKVMESRNSEPIPAINDTIHERRASLLASLNFEQMDSRWGTIKNAYSTTCQWFLRHPTYTGWTEPRNLQKHHGFLWMSGKPGAGKSTLMKFAHAHAEKERSETEVIVSFFFNARGVELERSTAGMYRALLHQLLNQAPDLQYVLDDLNLQSWTTDVLCKLFLAAVARLGQRHLKCFVDALDECNEQQIQEMVLYFEELGTNAIQSGNQLYMCFASRHYPTIDIQYGERLILEDEQGHGEDMAKYVHSHLRAGKGRIVEEVKLELQEKANGVFLWVVLVVNILNDELRRGRIFDVKRRLHEIPPRLSDLFKDILCKDQVNMADLLLSLQWILFAVRPLTREEFYFAMVAGLVSGPESMARWDPARTTTEDMDRFVLNSSKGLAELTKSKKPTVQFIHESVRDYLIKDDGMSELWPELGGNLQSLSHDRLKCCCQNYLQVDLSGHAYEDHALPKAKSQSGKDLRHALRKDFPFLEYASSQILRHAEEAVSATTSQVDFLKSFHLSRWIGISNMLQLHDIRRHTPNASLLYLLAENNCPKLIHALPSCRQATNDLEERYRYPIFAALANGHQAAVRALLPYGRGFPEPDVVAKLDYGRGFSVRNDQTPLHWALERGFTTLAEIFLTPKDINHDGTPSTDQTALTPRTESNSEVTVKRALVAAGIEVNAVDRDGLTSLSYAAQHGQKHIVNLLVDKGANIEAVDKRGSTALHWAFRQEQQDVVQLLVDKGANIEAADNTGWTALHHASMKGWQDMVELLVDKGVNIEAADKFGYTALHHASTNGWQNVIQLLVDKGVNIEAADNTGCTALHYASMNGWQDMVELLVDKGVNIEAADNSGCTALHYASRNGWQNMVQLLVDKGANIKVTNNFSLTALHYASMNGWQDMVESLVDKGASIEVANSSSWTALHWAF